MMKTLFTGYRYLVALGVALLASSLLVAQGDIKLNIDPKEEHVTLQIAKVEGNNIRISGVQEAYNGAGRYTGIKGQPILIGGDIVELHIENSNIFSVEITGDQRLLKKLRLIDAGLQKFDFSGALNLEEIDLTTPNVFRSRPEERIFDFSMLSKLKVLALGKRPIQMQDNGLRKPLGGTGQTQHIKRIILPSGGELEELYITNCGANEVNLGNLPKLKYLQCEAAFFPKLNLKNSPLIEEIFSIKAWFDDVDFTGLQHLKRLYMSGARTIKSVTLTNCPNLIAVILDEVGSLERVDVSSGGKLRLLSVAKCPKIRYIDATRNSINDKLMTSLVGQLPDVNGQGQAAIFNVVAKSNENNQLSATNKTAAQKKGWSVDGAASVAGVFVQPEIYPTDATDHVNVTLKEADTVRLYALSGALVLQAEVGEGTTRIDLSTLPRGRYIVASGDFRTQINLR